MAFSDPHGPRWRPRKWRQALKPEFGYPEAWVLWGMRAALAALAAYSLVVQPQYTTRPLLFISAILGLLIGIPFAFIATTRPRTLRAAVSAVTAMFMLHVMGHALGFYAKFGWYDKLLHFSEPFVATLVLYALSQATDWIWQWKRVTPIEVAIYCFSMVVTLGALWEILEFGMDTIFHTQEQNGNTDTMLDLIMDTTGALLGAILTGLATRYGRRNGYDKVAEEPKSDRPKLHFRRGDVKG